jgi:hypothetical protein
MTDRVEEGGVWISQRVIMSLDVNIYIYIRRRRCSWIAKREPKSKSYGWWNVGCETRKESDK